MKKFVYQVTFNDPYSDPIECEQIGRGYMDSIRSTFSCDYYDSSISGSVVEVDSGISLMSDYASGDPSNYRFGWY